VQRWTALSAPIEKWGSTSRHTPHTEHKTSPNSQYSLGGARAVSHSLSLCLSSLSRARPPLLLHSFCILPDSSPPPNTPASVCPTALKTLPPPHPALSRGPCRAPRRAAAPAHPLLSSPPSVSSLRPGPPRPTTQRPPTEIYFGIALGRQRSDRHVLDVHVRILPPRRRRVTPAPRAPRAAQRAHGRAPGARHSRGPPAGRVVWDATCPLSTRGDETCPVSTGRRGGEGARRASNVSRGGGRRPWRGRPAPGGSGP
jgi:hypothetical protein